MDKCVDRTLYETTLTRDLLSRDESERERVRCKFGDKSIPCNRLLRETRNPAD